MIGKLYFELYQQPTDGMTFSYVINTNGNPIVYDNGVDIVSKTYSIAGTSSILRNRIARCDDDFNNDETFNISGSGVLGSSGQLSVLDIKPFGTQSYFVAGKFQQYNGVTKHNLFKMQPDGTLQTYLQDAFGNLANTICISATGPDSNTAMYIGGDFYQVGTGYYFKNIIKLNANGNGSIYTGFQQGSGFDQPVTKIKEQVDGKILVGGFFKQYNGVKIFNLCRLNTNGNIDTTFRNNIMANGAVPGFDGVVNDFYIQDDGKIIVIGEFRLFNGLFVGGIVRLNTNGTRDISFNWQQIGFISGSSPKTIELLSSGDFVIGGLFKKYNNIECRNLIKISPDGNINDLYIPIVNNTVYDISYNSLNEEITAVGSFTQVDNDQHLRVVKFEALGNTASVLSNTFNGYNNTVRVVTKSELDSDLLYMGGEFTYATEITTEAEGIPIGDTLEDTANNTINNLQTYNTNTNVIYDLSEIENGYKITVTYLGSVTDNITYTSIFDIPAYYDIYYDNIDNFGATFSAVPQVFTPAHNPVLFKFNSFNYDKPKFKYLIRLYDAQTNELVGSGFKVSPDLDGSGEVDLQGILRNKVKYHMIPVLQYSGFGFETAYSSYFNYKVSVGEEYVVDWPFDTYSKVGGTSSISNNVKLYQTSPTLTHSYQVGDYVTVTSDDENISGLFSVVSVPNLASIVINKLTNVTSPQNVVGSVEYSDGKSLSFYDELTSDEYTVFDGACSWFNLMDVYKEFNNWSSSDYLITELVGIQPSNKKFLTNMPVNFTMRLEQIIYLNYAYRSIDIISDNLKEIKLVVIDSTGIVNENFVIYNQPTDNKIIINQVALRPGGFTTPLSPDAEYFEFYLTSNNLRASEIRRVYIDRRCTINDMFIIFKDRLGSIGSFSLPLRTNERIEFEMQTYNKRINFIPQPPNFDYVSLYDSSDTGTTVTDVNVSNTIELNTNWMDDDMVEYFEEMMTSPVKFLTFNNRKYAVTIKEKDFEKTRQRNKRLIRKTLTVIISNDNPINI